MKCESSQDNFKGVKVYIAGSAPGFQTTMQFAKDLREKGFEITSFWHDTDRFPKYFSPSRAIRDVNQVKECDLFIELIGDTKSKGGRHAELGMAIALDKKIILIGEFDGCIFESIPWLAKIETIEKFLEMLN